MGHKKPPVLSTAMLLRICWRCGFAHADDVGLHTGITILQRDIPIRAPISIANAPGTRLEKKIGKENRMGMTEPQDRLARAREEIATRVANFKATQEKFQREREEYFVTTLENAKHSGHSRPTLESAPF
jgi:hypothetical protein